MFKSKYIQKKSFEFLKKSAKIPQSISGINGARAFFQSSANFRRILSFRFRQATCLVLVTRYFLFSINFSVIFIELNKCLLILTQWTINTSCFVNKYWIISVFFDILHIFWHVRFGCARTSTCRVLLLLIIIFMTVLSVFIVLGDPYRRSWPLAWSAGRYYFQNPASRKQSYCCTMWTNKYLWQLLQVR